MMQPKDLKGKRVGRLVPVRYVPGRRGSAPRWICRCECGSHTIVRTSDLSVGRIRSCGCLSRQLSSKRAKEHPIRLNHGHAQHCPSQSPEYRAYSGAKTRCTNPNIDSYRRYGGRGIEFRFKSFVEFLSCVGLKPRPELTLERINNDGHYEPGNVRWATVAEQARNRSSVHRSDLRRFMEDIISEVAEGAR